MAFEKQLPEWNDIGTEPPQSKKDTGWEEREKPPAQWFNWLQNRTYEALKELQEKSALKTDLENIEVPVKSVNNKTGDVNLTADDIPVENINFTAENINGALTELFTNVSNGKSLIGGAITDVDPDVIVPAEPTFQQLANAISQINTGKKWASGSRGAGSQTLTVSGLGFRPSHIYVVTDESSQKILNYYPNPPVTDTGLSEFLHATSNPIQRNYTFSITSNGFSVENYWLDRGCAWVAYE